LPPLSEYFINYFSGSQRTLGMDEKYIKCPEDQTGEKIVQGVAEQDFRLRHESLNQRGGETPTPSVSLSIMALRLPKPNDMVMGHF